MRVGVYIDGLNLYYGGRRLCGRYERSWRWHDVTALADRLISRNPRWTAQGAAAHRIVYCTATCAYLPSTPDSTCLWAPSTPEAPQRPRPCGASPTTELAATGGTHSLPTISSLANSPRSSAGTAGHLTGSQPARRIPANKCLQHHRLARYGIYTHPVLSSAGSFFCWNFQAMASCCSTGVLGGGQEIGNVEGQAGLGEVGGVVVKGVEEIADCGWLGGVVGDGDYG